MDALGQSVKARFNEQSQDYQDLAVLKPKTVTISSLFAQADQKSNTSLKSSYTRRKLQEASMSQRSYDYTVSEASRLFRRTFQNEPQVIQSVKEASEIAATEAID